MRLSELLNSRDAALPKDPRPAHSSFREALSAALGDYVRLVEQLERSDSASEFVRDRSDVVSAVASQVLDIHAHVIRGQPSHARRLLDVMLDRVDEHVQALISIPVKPDANRFLFRMRQADPSDVIDRTGVFHIPFHLRHRAGPQRYSVPGVPMLYLGSSLLLCWTELGSPPLENVWVSRMEAREDLRVLNLGYSPREVGDLVANHYGSAANAVSQFAAHYAVLWPLIAACSFRTLYPGKPFIEEYVIAQLLTSWVSEQAAGTIDGIRYFSTRLLAATRGLRMNFVFVPREIGDDGHCDTLGAKLFVTEPLLWKEAVARRRAAGMDGSERKGEHVVDGGDLVHYADTEWAGVESLLGQMPCARI